MRALDLIFRYSVTSNIYAIHRLDEIESGMHSVYFRCRMASYIQYMLGAAYMLGA